ncbi:MAG: NAD-dependent epimerase/dehydratase family protein [Planctomycetes bacterium]|nr:NAD-dependent epimerase/dehydratase family protein [Planctomycetota bacterium]
MNGTASGSQRILITGGAGFVGSHLAELLVEQGHRLLIVDDLSTGSRRNLDHIPGDSYDLIEARVSEVLGACERYRPDRIFHLAAAVGVRLILERPIETIESNVVDTSGILEMASRLGVPTLVTSSSEVYGKSDRVPFREDDDVMYGATSLTRWLYACTKAIDEYLALAHYRQSRLPVVVARLFNTVGPRQIGHYGMVLPRFVAAALAGEPLEVYGDGQQVRCFCDVRDVRRALVALTAHEPCFGRVFNVGSDEPITIMQLAERVVGVLHSSSAIRTVPYEQAYEAGFEDLRVRQPDTSRLQAAIGFAREFDLDETIRDLATSLGSGTKDSGS